MFRAGYTAVLTRKQGIGAAQDFGLVDGSIKLPGFSGGKRDFAIRGRSDRKILIIIKDELDADPIEVFRGVIDDNATQMANSELASGPT